MLLVIAQPDAWSQVERAQQIGSHSAIKIIVDAGQSEQSDRLLDQRWPQPSSGSPTFITEENGQWRAVHRHADLKPPDQPAAT